MSRPLRPNLPGIPFHLTARVQWQQPLFAGIEARICHALEAESEAHGMQPIAHAVMSNHLHILAVQGPPPLGWFMQSLLRRIALIVNKQHGRQGHVFERRYAAKPCLSPEYLRTALAYVHLNPVRAGICATPDAYAWSSHGLYSLPGNSIANTGTIPAAAQNALRLFAENPADDLTICSRLYHRFLDWRLAADELKSRGAALGDIAPPTFPAGDMHWVRQFSPSAAGLPPTSEAPPPPRPEIRQIALGVLTEQAPDMDLETLRSGGRSRALAGIRRSVIVRSAASGHRTCQIARYLRVSQTAVSAAVTDAGLRRPLAIAP
jgi:REP element-mobilizing transposase RayT